MHLLLLLELDEWKSNRSVHEMIIRHEPQDRLQDTSTPGKVYFKRGELLLNAFVFFHIAEKVLSFSSLSPAFVFCLILLSFLEIAKSTPHLDENVLPFLFNF
jgi:hypothetical protein